MPFKLHRKGRHHIPRQKHRATNWRDYDAALRNRGSLTIWFSEEALADWKAQPRTTPGGQGYYSDLAIETALTLRAVFRLALRQTEGLICSIMRLLEINLPVPDHSTLSRRARGLAVQSCPRSGIGELHLMKFVDKRTGRGVKLITVDQKTAEPVAAQNVAVQPGPGADDLMIWRFTRSSN